MRALDYILLAVIALCAFFAFRTWRRALKSGDCCGHGGCNGDCAHCGAACGKHKNKNTKGAVKERKVLPQPLRFYYASEFIRS